MRCVWHFATVKLLTCDNINSYNFIHSLAGVAGWVVVADVIAAALAMLTYSCDLSIPVPEKHRVMSQETSLQQQLNTTTKTCDGTAFWRIQF